MAKFQTSGGFDIDLPELDESGNLAETPAQKAQKAQANQQANQLSAKLAQDEAQKKAAHLGEIHDLSSYGWNDEQKARYQPLVDYAQNKLGRGPSQGEIEYFAGQGGDEGQQWRDNFNKTYSDYQADQSKKQADQLRGQLGQQASDYRAKIPGLQEEMMNPQLDAAKRQLAGNINDVKTSSNQRGLLYSGIRQGQEADARGAAASQVASARANINSKTQAQADAYDALAREGNIANQDKIMSQAKEKQNEADQQYAMALQNRQQNFQSELFGQDQAYKNWAGTADINFDQEKFNQEQELQGQKGLFTGLGAVAGMGVNGLLGNYKSPQSNAPNGSSPTQLSQGPNQNPDRLV